VQASADRVEVDQERDGAEPDTLVASSPRKPSGDFECASQGEMKLVHEFPSDREREQGGEGDPPCDTPALGNDAFNAML
jgi:hypothetical protein